MIAVRFEREAGRLGLAMDGHAGHAQDGPDIVCAGCSAIAYALYGFLANTATSGWMEAEVSAGHMRLVCPDYEDARPAFLMAEIGLRQIAASYPGHVDMI